MNYLKPALDSLPPNLTVEQRDAAIDLLVRNADVFSKHEYVLGRTDLISFKINTGDHGPIARPLSPHPRVHLDVIDKKVENMFMAEYDFDVMYRECSKHINADCLSRLRPCEVAGGEPCKQCNRRVTGHHDDVADGLIGAVQTRVQRKRAEERIGASGETRAAVQQSLGTNKTVQPTPGNRVIEPGSGAGGSSYGPRRVAVGSGGEPRCAGLCDGAMATTDTPHCGQTENHGDGCLTKGKVRRQQRHGQTGILGRTAPQAVAMGVNNCTPEFLAEQQANDADISPSIGWLIDGERPLWEKVVFESGIACFVAAI